MPINSLLTVEIHQEYFSFSENKKEKYIYILLVHVYFNFFVICLSPSASIFFLNSTFLSQLFECVSGTCFDFYKQKRSIKLELQKANKLVVKVRKIETKSSHTNGQHTLKQNETKPNERKREREKPIFD